MADDTSIPHFFLPLIPGFLTNFRIPKSFLKHLKLTESNNDNEFVAVLKDRIGVTDKAWSVKVDSDGRRFMDGWKEFAQDHSLRVGDFLTFRYHGGFVFDVLVLDPVTACTRSFSTDPPLIQFKSVYSETNQHMSERKSVPNPPSKGDAVVFDPVSADPLVQSASPRSQKNKHNAEERVELKPSRPSYFPTPINQYSLTQHAIEKQKMKVKEKFDKCVKAKLLEICDVLDIPITKTTAKKSSKGKKRGREGSASRYSGSSSRRSVKSRNKGNGYKREVNKCASDTEGEAEGEKENDGAENGTERFEDDKSEHSEASEEDTVKAKKGSKKNSSRKDSVEKGKIKKITTQNKCTSRAKGTPKRSSSKPAKVSDMHLRRRSSSKPAKIFSRKKKNDGGDEEKTPGSKRSASKKSEVKGL